MTNNGVSSKGFINYSSLFENMLCTSTTRRSDENLSGDKNTVHNCFVEESHKMEIHNTDEEEDWWNKERQLFLELSATEWSKLEELVEEQEEEDVQEMDLTHLFPVSSTTTYHKEAKESPVVTAVTTVTVRRDGGCQDVVDLTLSNCSSKTHDTPDQSYEEDNDESWRDVEEKLREQQEQFYGLFSNWKVRGQPRDKINNSPHRESTRVQKESKMTKRQRTLRPVNHKFKRHSRPYDVLIQKFCLR